jgi:hypothetical protein
MNSYASFQIFHNNKILSNLFLNQRGSLFYLKIFLFFSPVSLTPLINIHSRISPRIFEKIRNGPNGILRGPRDTDLWKNLKAKVSCQTPFRRGMDLDTPFKMKFRRHRGERGPHTENSCRKVTFQVIFTTKFALSSMSLILLSIEWWILVYLWKSWNLNRICRALPRRTTSKHAINMLHSQKGYFKLMSSLMWHTANEGWWESNINVRFQFMYSQKRNSGPCYFQNRTIMFCLPISTFMYLWVIYIFPLSICRGTIGE